MVKNFDVQLQHLKSVRYTLMELYSQKYNFCGAQREFYLFFYFFFLFKESEGCIC